MPAAPRVNLRVDYALELINSVQGTIREASQELSAVPGFANQVPLVCSLCDQIKVVWDRIEQARQAEQARLEAKP